MDEVPRTELSRNYTAREQFAATGPSSSSPGD